MESLTSWSLFGRSWILQQKLEDGENFDCEMEKAFFEIIYSDCDCVKIINTFSLHR